MLWTLQTYIFREMGKAFVLTAIGLMAVIGLGGGVLNMIELEGITAVQLLKVMGLILPVSATLSLPVAALYAATSTYGRLSADNEFVACRSGGINIHVLFLPTLVFSLFAGTCSFVFINFVIPGMVRNIDRFIMSDLPRIMRRQLNSPSRLGVRDKVKIYADQAKLVEAGKRTGDGKLNLSGVAIVEMTPDSWVRFGTARAVDVSFGRRNRASTIAIDMHDINIFDAKSKRYLTDEFQPLGPFEMPQRIPLKVKWLSLGRLLQFQRQPSLFPEVEERMDRVRSAIAQALFYRQISEQARAQLAEDPNLEEFIIRIGDKSHAFELQVPKIVIGEDTRPNFVGGVTVQHVSSNGTAREITSDTVSLNLERTGNSENARVYLVASDNVSIKYQGDATRPIQRDRENLPPIALSTSVLNQAKSFPESRLLDPGAGTLSLGDKVDEERAKLVGLLEETQREIVGVLHDRLAFSCSAFVLVILGAALGVVFKGAHVMTAFGISFVPSLFVITMIITGKQLIESGSTPMPVGVGVLWLGIVTVAILDVFVLWRVLRR